ncbi:methyltransferase family protein [Xanthomonas sp.]|uniref:methyltransferase family protein n=1 Tax=Xanthomonas sp. TaxID=29446 RepID=UPI001F13B88F|nr:isoprenylcysteine carboxylmethyltransferase family protein [Xanthomonas sp.]
MRSSDVLFMLLGLGWGAYEALLSYRRRASDGGAQDQGTLKLLWRVLYAAVVVAVLLAFTGMWRFPPQWQEPLRWTGCALIAGGLALRLWAIRVLDRWFTVHVTIQADHRLIRHGPYRRLRHPSYTGALLAFYGLAIGLGNGLSLLAIVPTVTWAFLRRIRVEEALLIRAFPTEYPHYAARSWRLLPFVW